MGQICNPTANLSPRIFFRKIKNFQKIVTTQIKQGVILEAKPIESSLLT